MRQNENNTPQGPGDVGDAGDPALALVDALYEFAEQPEKWLAALEAIEKLPPQVANEGDIVQRLTVHAERAATIAQALNKARQDGTTTEDQWDAVLVSADQTVRQVSGNAASLLAPMLKKPLQAHQRPEFAADARKGFDEALATAASRKHGGLSHWQPISSDGTSKRFLLVMARAAFPKSLSDTFKLSEYGTEPLYALAILSQAPVTEDSRMRESLGLTRAEWRIAQLLKSGVSTQDAAEELGVSINTARTQVKSIFAKLDVSRQSELISRLSLTERVATGAGTASGGEREAPARQFMVLDDGRKLAWREYGHPSGLPLLVFHQWFAASMLPVAAADAAAGSGLRVIVFDRPGFGQSTPVASYTLEQVSRDAIALADRLRWSRFRVWGMASGAAFAVDLASRNPARVERIALAAPRLRKRDGHAGASKSRGQLSSLMQQPWIIRSVLTMMRSGAGEQIAMAMLRHATSGSPPDKKESSKTATARAILQQGYDAHESSTEGFTSELRLFGTLDQPDLTKIVCPLSVWHGEHDPVASHEQSASDIAQIPGAEFHNIRSEGIILSRASYEQMFAWLKR